VTPSRAERRSLGKRRLRREAHKDVVRVIELSEEGYSVSTIAASVGLSEEFVREVLDKAEAAREAKLEEKSHGL
jgi:DNA invertase Pin-like site-specific DNA recombinase